MMTNSNMTDIELVKYYKDLDLKEHLMKLMQYDIESYSFPEMHVEMFMAIFQMSSLKPEVFNIIVDFCYNTTGLLVLPQVESMVNRWERLKVATAYKALLQVKSDNEVLSIFRTQD